MSFGFCEHDDWLIWSPRVTAEERAALAAGYGRTADDATVIELAMEQVTGDVLRNDAGAVAGVWLPPGHGGVPMGTLQGSMFLADRPKDRDVRRFLKAVRRAPRLSHGTVTSYSVSQGEAEVGSVVIQHLMTHSGGENPVLSTYRLTVFPPEVEELYVLEFTTASLALLDEFEESFTDVVAGMRAVAR